jgi:hypothetical protein
MGFMKALRYAVGLLALSCATQALAKPAPASLSGVATQYFKSLIAADAKACLKQTITPAELQPLVGRTVDKKEHETALREFVDKRIGELKQTAEESGDVSLKRVEIIDVIILAPETSKMKKATAMAVVRPIIETSAGEHGGFPHYLLQAGSTWKISLKP